MLVAYWFVLMALWFCVGGVVLLMVVGVSGGCFCCVPPCLSCAFVCCFIIVSGAFIWLSIAFLALLGFVMVVIMVVERGTLRNTSLIILGFVNFGSDTSRVYLKDHPGSKSFLFFSLDTTLKKADIWFYGDCFRTHSFSKNCKHDNGSIIPAPSFDDDAIHDIPKL